MNGAVATSGRWTYPINPKLHQTLLPCTAEEVGQGVAGSFFAAQHAVHLMGPLGLVILRFGWRWKVETYTDGFPAIERVLPVHLSLTLPCRGRRRLRVSSAPARAAAGAM